MPMSWISHLTFIFSSYLSTWESIIYFSVFLKPMMYILISQFSSVQLLSRVRIFVTPWIAARQASLSITNSQTLLKPMSIDSVMPSSYLILCRPLLLLPPTPPSIRVFSNESTLHMRWPKYWIFNFGISPIANKIGNYNRGWKNRKRKKNPKESTEQVKA